jgi:outer membrane lipoprotein-sorting protein
MKASVFFAAAALVLGGYAFAMDAREILDRMDANETYSSIRYRGEMLVEYQGRKYVKTFSAVSRGSGNSFVEFDNPGDAGTRYLKLDGRLFVYSPESEEVLPISGQLLKESMMGSDLSYEDTIDNEKLSARYDCVIRETGTLDGRPVHVLSLTAKRKTESYPKQVLWVDAESFVALKFELYALSGAKLKVYSLIKAERIGKRYFPVEFEMKDMLRKGSRTVFKMSSVEIDAPIDDSVFSLKNLEK